jgi:hypothetical protein
VSASPPSLRALSRGRAAFIAALLILFAVLGIRHSAKVLHDRSAFIRWQKQILRMIEGVDISQEHNYPNPPIMAVLLEPLARMPSLAGALVWFYLKLGMALLSLYWVFRLVEGTGIAFPPWAKALTVLCSLKPILDDLNHGNVNLFILFLVVAALTAYRHRRDLLAGLLLALAISCKITPALFLPWLAWKRSWRALAGCTVGLALFFYPGVAPGLRLGMAKNQEQLVSWYRNMVHPFVVEGKVTSEHVNQSLPGLIFRLATDSPSFVTFVDDVETASRYDNLLSLTPGQAKWFVKGCMGLFVLLVVWCCRTPPEQREGFSIAAEMGVVVLGMLLFSERTWKHHCVTLMLPCAVLCYRLALPASPRLKGSLIGVVALVLVLTTLTGLGPARPREEAGAAPGFAKLALVYGAYTAACLVLLGALLALLRIHHGSRAASSEASRVPLADPAARSPTAA